MVFRGGWNLEKLKVSSVLPDLSEKHLSVSGLFFFCKMDTHNFLKDTQWSHRTAVRITIECI